MRIAVLCFVHKDAELVNVLLEQLLSLKESTVFIHLDKKSETIKKSIEVASNVHFIENNISVTWGDDSMMRALFSSLKEIYNQRIKYDYFLICTGQDLLVKKGLVDFLENNNGRIYLDAQRGRHKTYESIFRGLCQGLEPGSKGLWKPYQAGIRSMRIIK